MSYCSLLILLINTSIAQDLEKANTYSADNGVERKREFRIVENLVPQKVLHNMKVQARFYSEIMKKNRTDAYKIVLKKDLD